MTTRLSVFNHPLLLGFEQFERTLDRVTKTAAEGYPPYNIEQRGESNIRITLAVTGFAREDLSVHIEDNQLVVRGKQSEEAGRLFLHRGIAARQFQRSFVLADGIEATGATLENGLLHVDLLRPDVQPKSRRIAIQSSERPPQAVIKPGAGGSNQR